MLQRLLQLGRSNPSSLAHPGDCPTSDEIAHNPIPLMLVWMCTIGATLSQFGALMSAIRTDLALSESQAGLTQTMFFVGQFFGCLVIGRLITTKPLKLSILIAAGSMLAGAALCGIHYYPIMLAGRLLTGAGFSSTMIVVTTLICAADPAKRAGAMALMHALVAAAAAGMYFLAPVLSSVLSGWSWVVWGGGLVTTVVACVALSSRMPTVKPSPPATFAEMGRLTRHPIVSLAVPAIIGYIVLEQAMTMFVATMAKENWAADATMAASAGALFWGGVIVGRFSAIKLSTRFAEPQLVLVAGGMMGLFGLLAVTANSAVIGMPLILLCGFYGGPIVPLCFAWAARGASHSETAAITTCQMACCAGGIAGPLVIGTIGDSFGLTAALAVAAALVVHSILPIKLRSITTDRKQTLPPEIAVD